MGNEFKDRLSKVKDAWNMAKKKQQEDIEGGFPSFEDGRYVGKLVKAQVGESKSSQRLQICWTWLFYGGPYDGKNIRDYDGIETEENLLWLARKLNRLGMELPDDVSNIESFLEEMIDEELWASFTLKTKGDFQNLYINKILTEDAVEAMDTDEEY